MKSTAEKEFKVVIDENVYKIIDQMFSWDEEISQNNYYYGDAKTFTNAYDSTIRIREKNGEFHLQIKIPIKKENSLHIKKEFDREVYNVGKIIHRDELSKLTELSFDKDVYLLGKLSTRRKICLQYANVQICLDKNKYLGCEDYELEIEYTQEMPNDLMRVFNKLGVSFNNVSKGKFGRFKDRRRYQNYTS